MLYVALQMLFGDRLKYLSLIGGVAFAAFLMTQQAAIFMGLTWQTGASIRNTTGEIDLWVMDPEVEFSEDSKPIAETTPDRVRGIEGVEWAVPMYRGRRLMRLPDGRIKAVRVIGLDDATLLGGPPAMVEGTLGDLRRDEGVIVDEAKLASHFSFVDADGTTRPARVGDRFAINDQSVTIVGTYRQGRSFFWEPEVITTASRWRTLAPPERRLLTFVLVKVKPGANVAEVARRIEAATGYRALTPAGFIHLTAMYILLQTGILINFSVSVGLGFVIGVLVAGQTFYHFMLENLRYYATLKALGAGTRVLVAMVATQALTVGGLGYGLGVGLAAGFGFWFRTIGPGAYLLPWQIPAGVAVAILCVSLLSGLLALVRVLRIEAAVVFRS